MRPRRYQLRNPAGHPTTLARHHYREPVATIISIISLIVGAAGVVGAIGAWLAAARANRHAAEANELAAKANALAEQANETNTKVAAIEQRRHHNDLRPQFELTFERASGGQHPRLEVKLAGPPELGRLDKVAISMRNDQERRSILPNGPKAEDLEDCVWGPYRFRPFVDGADQAGRQLGEFSIEVGDARTFALEPSLEPHWHVPAGSWTREQKGKPIRLTVTSTREGHEPWTKVYEIKTPGVAVIV